MVPIQAITADSKNQQAPQKQSTKTTQLAAAETKLSASFKSALINAAAAEKAKAEAEKKATRQAKTNSTTAKTSESSAPVAVNAKDLISWGNHRFFVTPGHARSFKGLQISTTCNTEDEEKDGEKYAKKKYDGSYEMHFTAILDQRLGETDVRTGAMALAEAARTGATHYVYSCGEKLFIPQMMGTGANIRNILTTTAGRWIGCEVEMTLKQASKGKISENKSGSAYKYGCTVYYSMSSGAIQSVWAGSNISFADARKKAWAKVPKSAHWASENKAQATNQTMGRTDGPMQSTVNNGQTQNAKNDAKSTTDNAKKDAEKYVSEKVSSLQNNQEKVTTMEPGTKIRLFH